MKKTTTQFIGGFAAFVLALVSFRGVYASAQASPLQTGTTYYVSPGGDDANPCSLVAPCATFNTAMNLASSGDLIVVLDGTYMQALVISKSGLTVQGQNAVITASPFGIKVESTAQNVVVRGFTVTGTSSHAIYILGQSVTIENNTVYHNVLENGSLANGAITCYDTAWGSAIKVGLGGANVTIQNNSVYENCGEGIATTRGSYVLIQNNTVYDNKSVNIYVDNSYNVQVLSNNIYCMGVFPKGIALGEEFYADWGAQLRDVMISGNTVTNCQTGIMAFTSDVGGTLTNVTISSNNIPSGQKRGISLDNNANSNVLVANNIHFNSIWVRSTQGVTLTGNTQVNGTPAPTATTTSTSTQVPTQTSTPAPTNTVTSTPVPTITNTSTPTSTPTTTAVPAETYFDDKHAAFVYGPNWTTITHSKAYNGSYRETAKNGSYVAFTFTGTSFSILYTGGTGYRDMKVYVDDILAGTINQKLSVKTFKARWDYTGQLAPGAHTLKLVFSTSSTTTKGSVDAVIVR